MKFVIAIILLVFAPGFAHAEDCNSRFTRLLVDGNSETGPTKIHVTQEIVGGAITTNFHYSDGNGNGMTEMIEPASGPWSLFIGDNIYSSGDKGTSWSKVSTYDAAKARADMKVALRKDAAGASDVKCDREALEGQSHETVEGTYNASVPAGAVIQVKYWLKPESGMIVKSRSHLKMTGFESVTTQLIELFPDLVLPSVD